MWKAYQCYDPQRGPMEMWIKASARWRMKDVIGKRMSIVEDAEDDLAELDMMFVVDGIENAYHEGEIVAAINSLTPAQREYVYRRFWLGQTERDMKVYFGYTPTGLWHSTKNGARMKLRKELAHLA